MEQNILRNTIPWVRGKCIGTGSFGTVYLASNLLNGTVFAVKSVEKTTPQAECLENEIRVLSSLSSPFIVSYLGDDVSYESSSSTSYRNLHMEYLPRGTVAEYSNMDDYIIRSNTRCIVSALWYIHARGIVHCDVKGRNVLVGPNPGFAKLADFGSAIKVSEESFAVLPRGSPLWMGPEVVRGEYQGPESDVWSLACTVIEMVTGKPAWEDRGLDTMRRIGYTDELPELPGGLSELGRDFVDKCLKRDKTQRWSCDQLLQHPFISSVGPNVNIEPSPRCVLDWFNSDSEDEEEEELELGSSSGVNSTKQRICNLASRGGEIWESEGWELVRGNYEIETGKTSPVYSGSNRISEGTAEIATISEIVSNFRGRGSVGGGHVDGSRIDLFGCGDEVPSWTGSPKEVDSEAVLKGELLVGLGRGLCIFMFLIWCCVFLFDHLLKLHIHVAFLHSFVILLYGFNFMLVRMGTNRFLEFLNLQFKQGMKFFNSSDRLDKVRNGNDLFAKLCRS